MQLKCSSCDRLFTYHRGLYTCDTCGPLQGTLEVVLDYKALMVEKHSFNPHAPMYQFKALLPVKNHSLVADAIGGTPLIKLAKVGGMETLLIKNEGQNLSASLKDRASLVAVNMALEEGYTTIFCASTGNAASSLSLVSASSPLETVIFVPKAIPKGKLAQLRASGSQVKLVEGTYDHAFDLSLEEGLGQDWYCRNSAVNPFNLEGKKTCAYEILVQNNYQVPDYCLVGVGDGTVISALIKGFEEFYRLGLVNKVPRVIGVQSKQADSIKKVFDQGPPFIAHAYQATSRADSISVGNPRDVIKACKSLARNGGWLLALDDEDIMTAVVDMTRQTGIFAEPAGAAPWAGLQASLAKGTIKPSDQVVLVVTGNGLKDTRPVEVTHED